MKKLVVTAMTLILMVSSLLANQVTRSGNQGLSSQQIKSYPIKTEVKGNRTALLTEGFEGTFPPASWSLVDADGDTHNWIQGTTPGQTAHTGDKSAVSESWITPPATVLTPDNWMISPAITITAGSTTASVNWWDAAQDPNYPAEKYGLYVSTTDATPASFTQLAVTTLSTDAWTERTQDLSAYVGQTIYLAWRHFESSDNFQMKIDDVVVNVGGGTDVTAPAVVSIAGLTGTPDTALNLTLVVADDSDVPATFAAKYNIGAGDVDFTMTKSTKAQYTYTGTIPAQAAGVSGSVKFNLIDNLNNQAWSSDYSIGWATPVSYVFNENFDAVTAPALPAGWTVEDVNADGKMWMTNAGDQQSAPNCLKMGYNASMAMDDWIYAPAFSPVPNTPYKLKFSYKAKSATYPEKFEIKSGATPAAASMTTVLSAPIDVPLATYVTDSVSFTPTTGDPIYIGFHGISAADMFNLYLDDIQLVGAFTDLTPPVAATPTGTTAATGAAMTIQTVVTDQSGIASVVGHYQLAGQATWTDITMTASKVSGTYTGTIDAQAAPITGKVKFTCTDTVTPANTGDSPEFDIAWENAAPEPDHWIEWGANYAIDNGVGIADAPWWAAIDYDLGTLSVKLVRTEASISAAAGTINVPFKAVRVSQATAGTLTIAEDLGVSGVLVADGETQALSSASFNSNVDLTGYFAVAFAVPGGYINRDIAATGAHTWVQTGADAPATMDLLGALGDFLGAWWIRLGVVGEIVGINDNVEMLPGKSELSQNYPNPFNPSTSINFYNNMTGNVKLTVMNAKGETVATLINNNVVAGNHKVNFDGARFNSGVYFYKLETPTATITKKMLLVK